MHMISTRAHGVLDYLVSIILIAAPWLLGFAHVAPARNVPVILGVVTIVYSLMTRYEWSAAKVLPMRAHLTLDVLSGILLAASPWLFGFSNIIYWPHLLVGLLEILIVLLTDPVVRQVTPRPGQPSVKI